jgi:hypothetical protein
MRAVEILVLVVLLTLIGALMVEYGTFIVHCGWKSVAMRGWEWTFGDCDCARISSSMMRRQSGQERATTRSED